MSFQPRATRAVALFLPACSVFLATAAARADDAAPAIALTLSSGGTSGVTHVLPNGQSFTRAPSQHPEGVNFEDCMLDVHIDVPLTITGATAGAYPLSVFAGKGCDTFTSRQTGGAGATCWPVFDTVLSYTEGAGYPVSVPVRQIITQLYTSTKTGYAPVPNDAVCYSQPDSAARTTDLYFLLTTTDVSQTVAVAMTSFGVDLAAAAPPTSLSVGIGDTVLFPKWNAIVDPDITGFDVYSYKTTMAAPVKDSTVCDDAAAADADTDAERAEGGDGGAAAHCHTVEVFDPTPATDAGNVPYEPNGFACASPFPVDTSSDGGAVAGATETVAGATLIGDGGTVTSTGDAATAAVSSSAASIGPLELQPNETGDTFPLTAVAGNVTTATVSNLTDSTAYAFAVAATDGYGNVGAFTSSSGEAVCQYPLPTTDFFTSYADEGGDAGGSFCTFGTSDIPTGAASSAFVTLVGLAASIRRLRRRARMDKSTKGEPIVVDSPSA